MKRKRTLPKVSYHTAPLNLDLNRSSTLLAIFYNWPAKEGRSRKANADERLALEENLKEAGS